MSLQPSAPSKMASKVETIWKELADVVPLTALDLWWPKLLTKYSDSSRHYHNTEHLVDKFEHLESVKEKLHNRNAVVFALFFNYLEYDPKSADCEEKNLKHFEEFADLSDIPKDSLLRQEVIALLQAAATNSTDEHKTDGVFGAEDLHYFLDIDMAVLGSEPDHYTSYTGEVRKEYSFLPDAIYQSLRLKVLQNFLQIPNIFASKEFREKFESQARQNIQSEVESLMP